MKSRKPEILLSNSMVINEFIFIFPHQDYEPVAQKFSNIKIQAEKKPIFSLLYAQVSNFLIYWIIFILVDKVGFKKYWQVFFKIKVYGSQNINL